MSTGPWTGDWVSGRLDLGLRGEGLREFTGLALRRNPRRAHLLVSTVLGKHVPQSPAVVYGAGHDLGTKVLALIGSEARPLVLGYAETATGLGHCVADALPGATYLHSTRRPVPGVAQAGGFEEEHSHATSHLLLPEDPELLARPGPLVLVDDELSTGRTVLNTIRTVHALAPREQYVIAALIDVRSAADRAALDAFAAELGARVDTVALAAGTVELPTDVLARGVALVAEHEQQVAGPVPAGTGPNQAPVERVGLSWPAGVPDGGRHGFTPEHREALEAALPTLGKELVAWSDADADADADAGAPGRRVLVLGFEELMYAPLRLAQELENQGGGTVHYSTTTRSPVLAVDDPGYAIRTRLEFPSHDNPSDGDGPRFAYNVAPGADRERRFDEIILVVDTAGDTPQLDGLLKRLSEVTDRVGLVTLPTYTPEAHA